MQKAMETVPVSPRGNPDPGAHLERPRQPGLLTHPGKDRPNVANRSAPHAHRTARNLNGLLPLQAPVSAPNAHVPASAVLASGTGCAFAQQSWFMRAKPAKACATVAASFVKSFLTGHSAPATGRRTGSEDRNARAHKQHECDQNHDCPSLRRTARMALNLLLVGPGLSLLL
jgi:hypothetical protein